MATEESLQLRATDLICFPWAIVEVKKNKEKIMPGAAYTKHNRKIARKNEASEQFCYCQAANASASALTMREELTVVANDPSELRDALVIFSFTCIGPSVKLWVTYRRKPVGSQYSSKYAQSLTAIRGKIATGNSPLPWCAYGQPRWS